MRTIEEVVKEIRRKVNLIPNPYLQNELFDEILEIYKAEQEPRIGHWTNDNYKPVLGACCYECTCCGYGTDEKYKFCPNCGAKMEGEE